MLTYQYSCSVYPGFDLPGSSFATAFAHKNGIESFFLLGHSPLDWLLNIFILFLVVRFLVWPLVALTLSPLDFRRRQSIEMTVFELVPYHTTSVHIDAMTELFKIIHAQYGPRSQIDRVLRRKNCIMCELVSSRGGIHYIVYVPAHSADSFQRATMALQHEMTINQIKDYSRPNIDSSAIFEVFKQSRSFMFPLRRHTALGIHDPIKYLTSALANPKTDETFVLQFVLVPYSGIRRTAFGRQELIKARGFWDLKNGTLFNTLPATHGICTDVIDKIGEPLYYAEIRACVSARTPKEAAARMDGITNTLATFDEPGYQALIPATTLHPFVQKILSVVLPQRIRQRLSERKLEMFNRRLSTVWMFAPNILSVSEIASLYQFPYEKGVTTEGVSRAMSRTLATPNTLKRNADTKAFDFILGESVHHGHITPIGLTVNERERHVYIVGGTGNGKTTMLEYGAVQDMRAGKGIAFIDPHGDSARKLLRYVPEERLKDVIYFNPRDYDHPIGLNLLELPEHLSGSERAHGVDLLTEAIISILGKVFDDEGANAYRIERILRNAIHTALTVEGATLFTVLRLLTESSYRKQVVQSLEDERLRRFWVEEFGKAGDMQRVKLAIGPITRLERFEASESVRRVLGQPNSTINFDDILNNGKILICNFSKGSLGEDTSTLFGTTVLAKLQLAAWRREEISEEKRRPFYMYVDEFQNFASDSFMGFFSEARKYKVFVTMAQQSVSQLKDQSMLNTIVDNVGTVVAFRSKGSVTENLLLHQFRPYVEQGDILNLPSYSFYAKIAATDPMEPLSGRTIVLPQDEANNELAQKAIEMSRARYTLDVEKRLRRKSTDSL